MKNMKHVNKYIGAHQIYQSDDIPSQSKIYSMSASLLIIERRITRYYERKGVSQTSLTYLSKGTDSMRKK